ncbi:alpha/beta fold hydrolase [Candidatus Cyanaurora vandensis]|uniref:alpha/beta fold hydrolase n=1 Tax=Candidatus Cyanaurora vandensis TaxID=2714958 RepID=UPI002579AFC9|nr:alpha/beta hydrolase [Candidatus Cyanaurora vandensis]
MEPALVFLHCFGGSGRSWNGVISALVGRRCVAPDLRGFAGAAEWVGDYTLGQFVQDLKELVVSQNLGRHIVVGHSMGGKIALAYAATQPPDLHSLVLIAPSPPTPEPIPAAERERLRTTHGERAAAYTTIQKITYQPLPMPLLEQAIEDILRSSPVAWQAWLEQLSREDISATMAKITVPALVVVGEADTTLGADLQNQAVIPYLKAARLVTVPRAGHLLPLEDPQALVNAINIQNSMFYFSDD